MTPVEAVRYIALNNVFDAKRKKPLDRDPEAHLRKVFRWYSKTFFTPLDEVENLPLISILLNWWEVHYEELAEDQASEKPGSGKRRLEEERDRLLEDPEALAERQREEDADDAVTFEMSQELAQQDLQDATKATVDALQAATDALSGLGAPLPPKRSTGAGDKSDLTIKFENFDDDVDPLLAFGLLDEPRKRK